MFLLAREWFDRRDATFTAVLYAVNPYFLLIIYWRSAFAELLAAWLLPLLLLLVLRVKKNSRNLSVLWALVLASAWLTNAPAAVMVHYSLALLLFVAVWETRSFRGVKVGIAALLLGAGLASFYLVPAIYEQRWVDIGQAISQGYRPIDNFLFVHTADAEHNAFNRVVSWIAIAEMAAFFLSAWFSRQWRKRNPQLWYSLSVWAGTCILVMLPFSKPLWDFLPKIRFMQFPWRWLLCLNVSLAPLLTMAARRWSLRIGLYAGMLGVVAFVWQHYQAPYWDYSADMSEMQDNMASQIGYEGTDEYTPTGTDPSLVDKEARRVTVQGPAHAAIHVLQWSAEKRVFTAEMAAPDNVVLKLFNYPAWRVQVNGDVVVPGVVESTGQMLVPVQAGVNRVEIILARTWDRRAGMWISCIAAIFVIVMLWKGRASSIP